MQTDRQTPTHAAKVIGVSQVCTIETQGSNKLTEEVKNIQEEDDKDVLFLYLSWKEEELRGFHHITSLHRVADEMFVF